MACCGSLAVAMVLAYFKCSTFPGAVARRQRTVGVVAGRDISVVKAVAPYRELAALDASGLKDRHHAGGYSCDC